MDEIIRFKNISKDYHLGKSVIHALKDIDFAIPQGSFLSIVGPSGCGKTTMLNLLGLIDKPSQGEIYFKGREISNLSDNQQSELRLASFGFIFQSFNLIPVLNIVDNIEFPLILAKTSKAERKKRVMRLVDIVGLRDFIDHKPDELSGGQRQRVAIARALVNEPSLVIADEPTANLDSITGESILEVMEQLNKEEKVTIIFSTHNLQVMKYAKEIIHLKDGVIESRKKVSAP
ncbi:MAG: ABC transporter ATP-binding protein [Spirochaetales bacterium]|nr:ABC transporter ATP-binding protein [Spirochaetales bacterium]